MAANIKLRNADVDDVPCPDAFWLDGCSWGCGYYLGVIRGLVERWGPQVYEKRWGGSSSGSLCALGMALKRPMEDLERLYAELARQATDYGVLGKMSIYQDAALKAWLCTPGKDDVDVGVLNGRFFVGLTGFPCHLVLKSNFVDLRDLLDSLHASFHIPWYSNHIAPVIVPHLSNEEQIQRPDALAGNEIKRSRDECRTTWYIDGGLARNADIQLCSEGVTLNISPVFTSRIGIMDCVFPMSEERVASLQEVAMQDVLAFDKDACSPKATSHQLSRSPSVASLKLSRNPSAADLPAGSSKEVQRKPPEGPSALKAFLAPPVEKTGMFASPSYDKLHALALTVTEKLHHQGATVLASASQLHRIRFLHGRAIGVGRYFLALVLWANRIIEYVVYRHGVRLGIGSTAAFLFKRLMRLHLIRPNAIAIL